MPVVVASSLKSEIYLDFSEYWPRISACGRVPAERQCKGLRKSRTSIAIPGNLRIWKSTAYVPRVQAARQGCVGGSFDDCPAVRKQGHFVRFFQKFQDEVGVANAAVGLKAFAQFA